MRELRRQIGTNLYFRAGISKNPEKLLANIENNDQETLLNIRDPFAFEFLGIEAKEAEKESELEQALMDHLQEFLLELGRGFCFEARHKRIIIDDEYYFPDLVLYNRILHCTKKGPKMVEYALSGMDNQLFVSTYMLQLPDKEQLKEFLIKQMEKLGYED